MTHRFLLEACFKIGLDKLIQTSPDTKRMITKIIALDGFCRAIARSKPASQLIGLLSVSLCLFGGYALAGSDLNRQAWFSVVDTRISTETSTTPTLSKTAADDNLILEVQLAESLEVPVQAVHWQISDAQGVPVQQVYGQARSLKLKDGHYHIKLSIGQFTLHKELAIQAGIVSRPYFKAELGRLAVTANHAADWTIKSLNPANLNFTVKTTQYLEAWVPAGFYEITPSYSGVARRQVVNILAGNLSTVNIDIPVVQVSLIAVENNQPLFKPVAWRVFRLEQGERQHIGNYYQHSQGITVPTGFYEVIATHDSTVRSRQFWVKENTNNKIILAMD